MNIRRRGGHVIVINPVKEVGLVNFSVPSDVRSLLFGSKIASLYVQPHIGGDIALLDRRGQACCSNAAPIDAGVHRPGHRRLRRVRRAGARHDVGRRSKRSRGVERATIEQHRRPVRAAKNVVFGWTMGITHHEHGVANVQAIVNLALLRGMVGRPHAGLLPIRGHSNVQGMGSVGVAPNLKQQILDNLETLPERASCRRSPGLDTMACMQAADRGEMRSAFCLGGNLFGSNPDAKFAAQALGKLELVDLSQHDAQHRPRLGPRPARRSSCRCWPATRSRSRRRRNRCSTSCASATAARRGCDGPRSEVEHHRRASPTACSATAARRLAASCSGTATSAR